MASIVKKYSLNAKGILEINDKGIFVENADTGELIDLKVLLFDFVDKSVKLSVNYDEDYE